MNENEKDVEQDSSPEKVEEQVIPAVSEDDKTPSISEPKNTDKTIPYSRFKEVNDELAALKKRPESTKSLEVDDYINISASLEGLDRKEQEFLAEQHKLTGRPLSELRKGENFLLWQQGYKSKVDKERALKPTGSSDEEERPSTISAKLREASGLKNWRAELEEKEKLLEQAGLYKAPKPPQVRQRIG